jgi:hypothetical protein
VPLQGERGYLSETKAIIPAVEKAGFTVTRYFVPRSGDFASLIQKSFLLNNPMPRNTGMTIHKTKVEPVNE